jgi:4-amino-4-deoxy-L-arabinose transferase-like glycosyltransferase
MSVRSLNFFILLVLLFVIAAALDLWFIRAWKRRRRKRGTGRAGLPPPRLKAKRRTAQTPPVTADSKSGTPLFQRTGEQRDPGTAGKIPRTEVILLKKESRKPTRKRGRKAASRRASLSVPGTGGRVSHVDISMDIPEGESIRLTLESAGSGQAFPAGGKAAKTAVSKPAVLDNARPILPPAVRPSAWGTALSHAASSFAEDVRTSARSLFALALILYLATRLIGLTKFPIYFFTDEAVQTNFAAEWAERGFIWSKADPVPVFFENAGQYEMNLSVYVQLIPYLIFGKSEFVTRAVSVLITLLGMAAMGWILRRAFRLPLWWSGVLLLSIVPVWFLHSRTAFEPGESIAFYALFLYFYMRSQDDSPWMLLPALCAGALAAYTYSPMQVVVAATGALLLISDLRHHWRHKWISLAGLGVLLFMSLPYLWFLHLHPEANRDQLAIVGSYWLNEIPFPEKLRQFFEQYVSGLDPRYWFLANPPEGIQHDIIRHLMKGYGHMSLWSLPFLIVGFLLCLANLRSSKFRTVLAALLAAPAGGAIAQITITRILVMVIPASLLTSLGVCWLLALFERAESPAQPDFLNWWRDRTAQIAAAWTALRESIAARAEGKDLRGVLRTWRERASRLAPVSQGLARFPRTALALGLFLVLGSVNVYMLWDSLTNGPTWYQNYELYGMQYGGKQLSAALLEYRADHPEANLIVSSSWANGTDEIFRFFLPEGFEFRTGTVLEYIQNYVPIGEQDVFVMTSEEYQVAQDSGRFSEIRIDQTLDYPNGQPGFYFGHLSYVSGIQEIIAAEKAELAKPVDETIVLSGETVRVVHSRLDMGNLAAGFDSNPFSLMRTQQDNPMALEMFFPTAHSFSRVSVRVGGAPTRLIATFYPIGGGDPQVFSQSVDRASDYRDIVLDLDPSVESSHIRLEIETIGEGEPTHVHVYEVTLEGEGWKSSTAGPSS